MDAPKSTGGLPLVGNTRVVLDHRFVWLRHYLWMPMWEVNDPTNFNVSSAGHGISTTPTKET